MRFAGPDVVLFLVGALLFGGAATALVQQGALTGGTSPTGSFTLAYETASEELTRESVDFTGAPIDADVTQSNVARVVVVIECNDPVPAGNTYNLQIQVTPPEGSGLTVDPVGAQCGGTVEVPVEVAEVPEGGTVLADSEAEALEHAVAGENATRAQGTWTVTVNGARAGGLPIGGLPAGSPTGTVAINVETWTARASPILVR